MITPTPASTAFTPSPVSYSAGNDELDRNTFLRLLTIQIQMQDVNYLHEKLELR